MAKRKRSSKSRRKRSLKSRVAFRPRLKKHQDDEYIPYIMKAELGILQAATADPILTDEQVRQAIRRLVRTLKRSGPATASFDASMAASMSEATSDVVERLMMSNLAEGLGENGPLPVENVIGVLGTIKSSLSAWSQGRGSRSYLAYLEQFFNDLGIIVRQIPDGETQ